MRIAAFLFLTTFVLAFATAVRASDPVPAAPQRLHFRSGVARAHGYLRHLDSKVVFAFHGHKGQHVFASAGGAVVIMIKFPDGTEEGAPGASGDCVVPESGDGFITVTHHRMSEFEPGPFILKVELHDADTPKKDH